jgi:hypothetical protein
LPPGTPNYVVEGAATGEHGEEHVGVVPQVKPLLLPPFH